jgi:predicted glutamine amidotransferase
MCIILSVYNNGKPDLETIKTIKNVIRAGINSNSDGIATLTLNTDKTEKVKKQLTITDKQVENLLKDNENINFHLRFATSGKVNTDNLHFWKHGDWFFAHNGMIAKYNFGKEMEKCDSLKFFEGLLEMKLIGDNGNINYKKIKEYSATLGLWGRFVLVNAKFKKVYYFGNWKIYLIKNNGNSTLIICSKGLNFKDNTNVFYGFEFEKDNSKVFEKDFEGIMAMNIKNKTHCIKDKEGLEKQYATTTYGSATDYNTAFGFEDKHSDDFDNELNEGLTYRQWHLKQLEKNDKKKQAYLEQIYGD